MAKTKTSKVEVSYEDAQTAQSEAKTSVKDSKTALTTYYKENKLKRSGDYADDKKHGKKIARLEADVVKAQDKLEKANAQVKELKPASTSRTKYDYPDDIDTPEKRKKYRQLKRAEANGDKPKKSKKAKKTKEVEVADDNAEAASTEGTPKSAGGNTKTKVKKKSLKKKSSKKKSTDD